MLPVSKKLKLNNISWISCNSHPNSYEKAFVEARAFISCGRNIFTPLCVALRDLVPLVKDKKRETHPWRSVTFSNFAGFSLQLY